MSFPTYLEIHNQAALIAHKEGLRLWDLSPEEQKRYLLDAEIKLLLHRQKDIISNGKG